MSRLAALCLVGLIACGGSSPPVARPGAGPTPTPGDDLSAAANGADPVANPERAGDPRLTTDLGSVRIEVSGTDPSGDPRLVATAPGPLLERGARLVRDGKVLDGIAVFRQVVRDFPDDPAAPVALANIALAHEGLRDTDAAVSAWLERAHSYPQGRDALAAHLRAAALEAQRERWLASEQLLVEIAQRTDLTYGDQLELAARRGYAQLERGELALAEASLEQARALWRRVPHLEDSYYVAMTHYYLGDLALRRFQALPIRAGATAQAMRADLDAKEVLALRAYDLWRVTLDFRQAYWATAAGYQMSNVFLELWRALVTAPYPLDVSAQARATYVAELHDRVRDRLEKALAGHQMNVELARAYGVDTYWSQESAARAIEILNLLDAEARGQLLTPPT